MAGGITVDMRGMHDVSFNKDFRVVSIGGGAIWSSDVYQYLVAQNLTAAGARLPGIGIGGFVLGGECLNAMHAIITVLACGELLLTQRLKEA